VVRTFGDGFFEHPPHRIGIGHLAVTGEGGRPHPPAESPRATASMLLVRPAY